jgi:acyl transferase domain-containing protein/phospholipid N-methyltransferase/acyl carrier protein
MADADSTLLNKSATSKRVLAALNEAVSRLSDVERAKHEAIAILGIGCRFPPNLNNLESYWQFLMAKGDAVGPVPANRWCPDLYYNPTSAKPGQVYVREGAFIDRVEEFDAEFFGISAREALSLDPQQRLLLEVTWEALENTGIPPSRLAGTDTAVFVGITSNDYFRRFMGANLTRIDAHFATGNALNAAAGRISYVLGLHGPSLAIDAACSSSLVAVHLACQSLRTGECRVALAGGVNLVLSPEASIACCQARMLAPDGRCKTFDAAADGYGRGEGCGMIVLKRLSDALADGDMPQALIRGSAVNQDGASSGLTVPNGPAQQKLIAQALAAARVEPDQVSYVEAHGTGTALGDPVEYRAAVTSYRGSRTRPLIVGAVKANIGHLEAAAGIAGLVKAVLVLQHRTVPPQLHFSTPNPYIPWEELPAIVPTSALRLGETDRFAAVSSFGYSGTNGHIVLETFSPPAMKTCCPRNQTYSLLVLSAKSPAALRDLASAYTGSAANVDLGDLCFSAVTTRESFHHRLALIAKNPADLTEKLKAFLNGHSIAGVFFGSCDPGGMPRQDPLSVGNVPTDFSDAEWQQFLIEQAQRYVQGGLLPSKVSSGTSHRIRLPNYPWQPQRFWPDDEPQARSLQSAGSANAIQDEIAGWLYRPHWQVEPLRIARKSCDDFPPPTLLKTRLADRLEKIRNDPQAAAYTELIAGLERSSANHIAEALDALGWKWSAGYSCNLEEFIEASGIGPARLRLIRRMLQILAEDGLVTLTNDRWHVTAANAVNHAGRISAASDISDGVAGTPETELLNRCGSRLAALLQDRLDPLALLFPADGSTSAATLYSESVGARIMNGLMCDTVREIIAATSSDRALNVLEVGGGTGGATQELLPLFPRQRTRYIMTDIAPLLVNRARDRFGEYDFVDFEVLDIERSPELQGLKPQNYDLVIAANVIHATRDVAASLRNVRQLLKPAGTLILLEGTGPVRFLDLIFGLTDGWWRFQDAPLRREHPLISADTWERVLATTGFADAAALGSSDPADGILSKQAVVIAQADLKSGIQLTAEPRRWLLLADQGGIADELLRSLAGGLESTVVVRTGEGFKAGKEEQVLLPSLSTEDIRRSLGTVQIESLAGIIHLWGCDVAIEESTNVGELARACELSTRTALAVLQGVLSAGGFPPPPVWFVTRGVVPLPAPTLAGLAQSPIWGMLKSVVLEHPAWKCACIDLPPSPSSADVRALIDEIRHNEVEREVALRTQRWVNRLVRTAIPQQPSFTVRSDATYLITGGSRGLGLAVAKWLSDQQAKHLALISRTSPDEDAQRAVHYARSKGCQVVLLQADVGDEDRLRDLLETIRSAMPPLRGVIHAAGILEDGLLAQQDWEHFSRVLPAKIGGAWNLHRLTAGRPLDFFVMFSSAASLLGSPGQTNHAAGNAFLDALAHFRQSVGLPGLSINWGPWSELGAAARHRVGERLLGKGLATIAPEFGLSALGRCIASSAAQIGVAPIDWPVFREQFASERRKTWLRAFEAANSAAAAVPAQSPGELSRDGALLRRVREAATLTRPKLLCEYVEERIREILRIDRTKAVANHRPLAEMGWDSLMSTELKNRIVSELGVDVPMQTLIAGATIADMVREIEQRLILAEASADYHGFQQTGAEMEEITL